MQFKSITSNSELKTLLSRLVEEKRISHAQLLLGKEGAPCLEFALAFAQAILCESPVNGDSCGNCASCTKAQKFVHPDIHFAFPVIKKEKRTISEHFMKEWRAFLEQGYDQNAFDWLSQLGAENKQLNITVEECQSIIRRLQLKPFEGDHKVMIIWLPEYLKDAGNILLKILEEPPENTVILLVSHNESNILQTILSRTQLLRVALPRHEEVAAMLSTNYDVELSDALQASRLAERNIVEARKIIQNELHWLSELLVKSFRVIIKLQYNNLIEAVEEYSSLGRENQKRFLEYALHFIRECVLAKNTGREELYLEESEQKAAKFCIEKFTNSHWEILTHLFENAYFHTGRNANPKLVFHVLLSRSNKVVTNRLNAVTLREN